MVVAVFGGHLVLRRVRELVARGASNELERLHRRRDDPVVAQSHERLVLLARPRLLLEHHAVAAAVVRVLRVVALQVVPPPRIAHDVLPVHWPRRQVGRVRLVLREFVVAQVRPHGLEQRGVVELAIAVRARVRTRLWVDVLGAAPLEREEEPRALGPVQLEEVDELRAQLEPRELAHHAHRQAERLGRRHECRATRLRSGRVGGGGEVHCDGTPRREAAKSVSLTFTAVSSQRRRREVAGRNFADAQPRCCCGLYPAVRAQPCAV